MDCWTLISAISGKADRVLFYGPPGTGKTFAATRMGAPESTYTVSLSDGSTEAELRGHYLPVGGEFVWQDGPAISAWRKGSRLVLNEIDHAPAEVLSFLHAIMDDHEIAGLTLPSGETVRPAHGFHVYATMNGDPGDLPPALRDRFPVAVEVDKPNPDAIAALPANLQGAARASAVTPDSERRVSTRSWAAFASLTQKGLTDEVAARAVFGARASDLLSALKIGRV